MKLCASRLAARVRAGAVAAPAQAAELDLETLDGPTAVRR